MRKSTRPGPQASVAAAFAVASLAACSDPDRIDVPTIPLSIEGTSPVEWSSHERTSHFVTASDDVRLAVDMALPAGYTGDGNAATTFPVVFRYTPYHRTSIVPETGEISLAPFDFFIARGYAYVAADMRGSGASFGWNDVMAPMMVEDARVIVDWIAAQPWSDGNVGMRTATAHCRMKSPWTRTATAGSPTTTPGPSIRRTRRGIPTGSRARNTRTSTPPWNTSPTPAARQATTTR